MTGFGGVAKLVVVGTATILHQGSFVSAADRVPAAVVPPVHVVPAVSTPPPDEIDALTGEFAAFAPEFGAAQPAAAAQKTAQEVIIVLEILTTLLQSIQQQTPVLRVDKQLGAASPNDELDRLKYNDPVLNDEFRRMVLQWAAPNVLERREKEALDRVLTRQELLLSLIHI